jgi:hypothetical protein
LTLTNVTISGNTAIGGGGILNQGPLTLTNVTITSNTATGSPTNGGGFFTGSPTDLVELKNTIVANNTGGNCSGLSPVSLGHNLDSDGTCDLSSLGDLPNTDPLLGPLQDNGGFTQTHALLAGSPAIDAGSPDCPPPATDQRGIVRPQGDTCDMGAFELSPPVFKVEIDIMPDRFPNSINPRSNAPIPVAILSDAFDATTVDPSTVHFGATGIEATPTRFSLKDVNRDGRPDLLLQFRTRDTNIACGDTSATLTGQTYSGQVIEGTDAIQTVGCR